MKPSGPRSRRPGSPQPLQSEHHPEASWAGTDCSRTVPKSTPASGILHTSPQSASLALELPYQLPVLLVKL